MKLSYDNRVVHKPWGEEYNIFRNKNKIAITYLKIKKGFSTSLHCHPTKKTGFLILKGTAEVQIGIYKKNIQKYKPMSILVLRPGLFHRIKANKNKDLFALEIENPYLKNDLIRMQDDYGRKNKGYEKLENTRALDKNDTIFNIPKINLKNKYELNGIKIEISYYKNFKDLKSYDDKSVSIILDGRVISQKKKTGNS
jgi:mannose-6-phosphate isomerase-like protein (cupin superfamily)